MRKFVLVSILVLLVAFDLLSKYYFVEMLDPTQYFPLFGEYFGLKLSYNRGIAFSLPIEGILLQIITILLIIGIVYYYWKEEYRKNSLFLDIGYLLILSGALSHAYERIVFGYVVDFLAFKYFAILNFADIFISVGAFFLVLSYGYFSRNRA